MDGNNIKHREIFNRYFVQALIEFFVLAAIISLIGLAAYNRMDILLIDSLRESVAQQGQSTAYVLGERFQHKLDELQARTELLQKGEISPEDAIAIATIGTRDGRLRGILRKNNTPLVGKPLPPKAFDAIHRTWLGHQSIEYLHGTGLIFAVPFVYEEESYIFYEVFDDEAVQDFYKMMSYNGKGTLILASNYDEWLLLAGGQYPALARGANA